MGRWEWYMVRNELWASAGLNDGFLCIACLESRIGRKQTFADFPDVPVHGFHRRFFPVFAGAGLGAYGYYDDYYPYGYYDYPYVGYGDGYSETGCYIVRQRVHTPHGWRLRRVQVCS
jgi:hypothetical protein